MDHIRHIIFDLGGVLLDIDPEASTRSFRELGMGKALEAHSRAKGQHELFDKLEIGAISPERFREGLREVAGIRASDEAIDDAWNAMLKTLPEERFRLLERLSRTHSLFLFSNTNAIHAEAFTRVIEETYGYERFRQSFRNIYFSHELGMRKPELEAFRVILEKEGLAPEETLFLDDTSEHVQGARKVGLEARHIEPAGSVVAFFAQEFS